jgi:hypothetical protein
VKVSLRILAACASLGLLAGPARAEQSIMEWPGFRWESADREVYQGIKDYAECAVEVRPIEVKTFLALPAGSPQAHDAAAALAESTQRCMSIIVVRMSGPAFRGPLIEALYRRDFQRAATGKATVRLSSEDAALQLAKCVTRADEQTADQLLRTPPASREQTQVFRQLAPVFEACRPSASPPKDAQILRYQIAEALYRQRSGEGSTLQVAK